MRFISTQIFIHGGFGYDSGLFANSFDLDFKTNSVASTPAFSTVWWALMPNHIES